MKKYASKKARKGRTAYRTPSPVRYKLVLQTRGRKNGTSNGASRFIYKQCKKRRTRK